MSRAEGGVKNIQKIHLYRASGLGAARDLSRNLTELIL